MTPNITKTASAMYPIRLPLLIHIKALLLGLPKHRSLCTCTKLSVAFGVRARTFSSVQESNLRIYPCYDYASPWEKESIHRPAPVRNFFLPKKNGGHRGKISVVDMAFLVFIGFLYSPPGLESFSLRPEKFPK